MLSTTGQIRAVRERLDVRRAEPGMAPAVRPAVVAVDHHEAALVPGRGDVGPVAVPGEGGLLQRGRQVGAVVELQRGRRRASRRRCGRPRRRAPTRPLRTVSANWMNVRFSVAVEVVVLELRGDRRAAQHRPRRRRVLVARRSCVTASSTAAWSLPMIRPTARSGSSSASFVIEYWRSDGMPLMPGERRHEVVVAHDRHVARADAAEVRAAGRG